MRIYEKVTAIFRSVESSVEAANILAKAYVDAVGKPEDYKPFGADNPEQVALNLAGLYAADTAANILSATRYGASANAYLAALVNIRDNCLTRTEKYVVKNVANATWRAGQPFRDMATKPLNRISREVNMQFNQLPPDEMDKDLVQVQAAASFLLKEIGKSAT